MRYSYPQVYLQEVPDEISLGLSVSGCPLRCKGCHSAETRDPKFGEVLDDNAISSLLNKNPHISCVLFYGGEWEIEELIKNIKYIKKTKPHLKVALYTGYTLEALKQQNILEVLIEHLDYLKVGEYVESLGGLSSPTTNQRFYKVLDTLQEIKLYKE